MIIKIDNLVGLTPLGQRLPDFPQGPDMGTATMECKPLDEAAELQIILPPIHVQPPLAIWLM